MVSLDSTLVNIALPSIGRALGADVFAAQWVVSGYTLALAALILPAGELGDRFGRRRVFICGSVGFALACGLCSIASNLEMLVAARVVEGIAAAVVLPSGLALISTSIDRRDHGAAIGAWAGLGGLAGIAGPIAGGGLVEVAGWRAAFLINAPLALIAAVILLKYVPEYRDSDRNVPMDLPGVLAAVAGLCGLAFGLISGLVWVDLCGVAILVLFVAIQVRSDHPLVPPVLFTSRVFPTANLVTLLVDAAVSCGLFLLVLQLQVVARYTPLEAGAATVPVTFILLVASKRMGHWAQRHGARVPMIAGPALAALGLILLTRIGVAAPFCSAVLPGTILLGAGWAVYAAPLTSAMLDSVHPSEIGIASGVNYTVSRTGQLLAVAALPGLAGMSGHSLTDAVAFGVCFRAVLLICAGLMVAGAICSAVLMPSHRKYCHQISDSRAWRCGSASGSNRTESPCVRSRIDSQEWE
ncbi:MFS transporter [Nocardia sp. NBC_01388]|uniref:MFS transporter n=1 Tax=Nocardia sp. NBC_01388 TaxID=2903596 RepID=UPI0032478EEA